MGSNPKHVEFTFDWKLRWADYDRIEWKMDGPRRYFVTSFNNVSFRWYARLLAADRSQKIQFYIFYDDGPLDKISGVDYTIGVIKSDHSVVDTRTAAIYEYSRDSNGFGRGFRDLEDRNPTAVRVKYELTKADRLTYQITIKIPTETFVYRIPSPTPAPSAPWMVKLFNTINDDGIPWPPDTKIAGRDGAVFKCHKGIVVVHSEALKTIFQYPPTQEREAALEDDEQSVENPKKRKASAMDDHQASAIQSAEDVYTFPNLCAASLKSVLEYLYTGKATTTNLTVSELIEMGDAGEQYDLKALKEFSAAELWKRVIIEEPVTAFEIARYADLHDEMKYLKHRALDVIAENYDSLGVKANEVVKRFGGTRGVELHNELEEYMGRRLRSIIKQ